MTDAGSGGAATSGPVAPAIVSAGQAFLDAYAASVCAMYESCCIDEGLDYHAAGCTEWYSAVTAAYFAGDYDETAGEACLQALADARSEDPSRCATVISFSEATLREECRSAFTTPERDGSPLAGECLLARDCASSSDGPVICYGGICLLERRGRVGQGPCDISGSAIDGLPTERVLCNAADGLYCDRTNNVCAEHVGVGEACPFNTACSPDALCVGGTCEALPGPGEPCLNAIQGAGGFCRVGSACDVDTLVCGPPLEEGDACREPAQCATGVCRDGVCGPLDFTRSLNCTGQ